MPRRRETVYSNVPPSPRRPRSRFAREARKASASAKHDTATSMATGQTEGRCSYGRRLACESPRVVNRDCARLNQPGLSNARVSALGCQSGSADSWVDGALCAAGRSLPEMSLALALMAAINGSTGSWGRLALVPSSQSLTFLRQPRRSPTVSRGSLRRLPESCGSRSQRERPRARSPARWLSRFGQARVKRSLPQHLASGRSEGCGWGGRITSGSRTRLANASC